MPVLVEQLVVRPWDLAAFGRGNAGFDALIREGLAEPVAVVAPITEQRRGRWQRIEYQSCALMIVHLTFGKQQNQRLARVIADGVELRVQSALRPPDTTGNIPFFRRLAAVRWAFRWVASIMMRSGLGPSAASPAKMRSNTPRRLQRMKRL